MTPPVPKLSLTQLRALVDADRGLQGLSRQVRQRLDADPAHDFAHAERVALWALELAPGVEPRQVVAAAFLHDMVNLPKDSPRRSEASELSAKEAERLLPGAGFDPSQVKLIADAIRTHSFSRGEVPKSDLGRALQDADRLEALGVLGVFRVISTGSRMAARYFDPDDPFAEQRALDDRSFSVDHFFTKLLELPATMQTDAGRREALRRVAFLREFLAELAREIGVTPPRRHALETTPHRERPEPARTS